MHDSLYDRSPMWPRFNHGCPKRPPEDEPYNTPYAVLGYTEAGEPVFTVHTLDGDTYEVEAGGSIVVLKDTTYGLSLSKDADYLVLTDSDGKTSSVPVLASDEAPGLLSAADKAKLDGIEAGAQVNTVTGVKGSSEAGYQTGEVTITKAGIGLGNVENKSASDILDELTASDIEDALGYTPADAQGLVSGVSGVKGNAEEVYRTGDVNLTKENLGLGTIGQVVYHASDITRVNGIGASKTATVVDLSTIEGYDPSTHVLDARIYPIWENLEDSGNDYQNLFASDYYRFVDCGFVLDQFADGDNLLRYSASVLREPKGSGTEQGILYSVRFRWEVTVYKLF